jgi:hypothetical protein
VIRAGVVVLDDEGEVLAKYRSKLSGRGQPGAGDAFLKFVSENQYNSAKVVRLSLPRDREGEYTDFPSDAALRTFDKSDRVFVALARRGDGSIINAVDSDYSEHADALESAGVVVKELCPNCLKKA